jgi:hypothetical protein
MQLEASTPSLYGMSLMAGWWIAPVEKPYAFKRRAFSVYSVASTAARISTTGV